MFHIHIEQQNKKPQLSYDKLLNLGQATAPPPQKKTGESIQQFDIMRTMHRDVLVFL